LTEKVIYDLDCEECVVIATRIRGNESRRKKRRRKERRKRRRMERIIGSMKSMVT
jgi:hypothetical protein